MADIPNEIQQVTWKNIMCRLFKKYFQQTYLYVRYFDGKIKEFHELKLGQMTMDEFPNKFLDFLRYFKYIKDDNARNPTFPYWIISII